MRGLYGAVRFVGAAEAVGLHPVIGLEIELIDPAVADPGRIVVPPRRARRRPRRREDGTSPLPIRWRRACRRGRGRSGRGCPVIASRSRRTCAGSASAAAGPHLVLLARVAIGLAEPVPADLAGEHGRDQGRAAVQPGAPGRPYGGPRRPVGLSRRGARAPPAGGRPAGGARRRGALRIDLRAGRGPATSGFFIELSHHLLADDDWLVAEAVALADELGLPVGRHQRRPLRPARGPRAGSTS